jgi:hypothetical protein
MKIHQDISIGNGYLNRNPIAQEIIGEIDKWDYIKLKCCIAKEIIFRMKRQATK